MTIRKSLSAAGPWHSRARVTEAHFRLGRRIELVGGPEISTRLVDPKNLNLTFGERKKSVSGPTRLPRHRPHTSLYWGLRLRIARLTTLDDVRRART